MTTRGMLGRRAVLATIFVERYGLSLVFLCLAGMRLHRLLNFSEPPRAEIGAAPLVGLLRDLIWVQLYGFTGFLLLLGRRIASPPRSIRDILVPMGTTFFYLLYYAVPWFPAWFKHPLCPAGWQSTIVITGVCLNLLGLWIAIWAAVYLGRSFGILIEVRKVVLDGAYRRVRHPMYLGYLFFLAGFAVANFSPAYFILIPMHMSLLIYRARLEEARLAECSPAYREYQQRTGFIFPKFRPL